MADLTSAAVIEFFRREDPEHLIALGSDGGEYDGEATRVYRRLCGGNFDRRGCQQIVWEIFGGWIVGPKHLLDTPLAQERYFGIASRLYDELGRE